MIRDNQRFRILLVEDNPGDYTIVEDLLLEQIASPVIVHATNFREASGILSTGTSFDVILLDLSLQDKQGPELIDAMLAVTPGECPIIILTGYSDIDFSIRSIGKGIMDYLLKDELTSFALYKSILYSIERVNNVRELKASAKRYTDLFNLSPQPMWVSDIDTQAFIQVNKAAIALYGYEEEEFLALTVWDLLSEDYKREAGTRGLNDWSDLSQAYGHSQKHQKKSGEQIDVEIYSTPIHINGKDFHSVIVIDVTERNIYQHRITKAIIKTQEDERYEIGAELHDNVCQILATCQLSLGMLKDSLTPMSEKWFEQCRKYVILATEEIRNLSHRLAPAFFNDSTLEEAFRMLLQSFNVADRYQVALRIDRQVNKGLIPLDVQLNLYRILQEQLKNILKYSKATGIEIELLVMADKLRMTVRDNGVGFDPKSIHSGIGMANMKRRAELFSGKFDLQASPGNGCTIIITIPVASPRKLITKAEQPSLSIRTFPGAGRLKRK